MQTAGKEESTLLLGVAVAALLSGFTGRPLPGLLLGLLGYLGWHLYQLARLPRLLGQSATAGPYPFGLWRRGISAIQAKRAGDHWHAQELEALVARFRGTVSALPDAVVIVDSQGAVIWSNPAAAGMLGIAWPAAAGRLLSDLMPDPLAREYMTKGDFAQPLVFNAPAERSRLLSLAVMPLVNEQETNESGVKDPGRQILLARDITRQYHLDAAKRDFVANISHELRTPLTVISGLAEQLDMDGCDSPASQRATQLMLQQVQRMSGMTADLLTLSRLEMQQESGRDEQVDVPELLATIVEEARALSGKAGHVLLLELESADGLRGDAKELRTAFSNLVANAVRHTPNRSEIRVNWRVEAGGAHLAVSDTGAGIALRHIPRLTERLYRVDPGRSRDTGGSGLGLAIVKHILDRHDAKLEITSKVGGGSVFTCHFPPDRILQTREDRVE
ncbi:MAG: phosphate regulon sensor histidine kinase PhoR [Pseudomonadota bacterium]|nr:phosphate regulon sensor histidine kinase PhoR [Pseudomonadota bacterium]